MFTHKYFWITVDTHEWEEEGKWVSHANLCSVSALLELSCTDFVVQLARCCHFSHDFREPQSPSSCRLCHTQTLCLWWLFYFNCYTNKLNRDSRRVTFVYFLFHIFSGVKIRINLPSASLLKYKLMARAPTGFIIRVMFSSWVSAARQCWLLCWRKSDSTAVPLPFQRACRQYILRQRQRPLWRKWSATGLSFAVGIKYQM